MIKWKHIPNQEKKYQNKLQIGESSIKIKELKNDTEPAMKETIIEEYKNL